VVAYLNTRGLLKEKKLFYICPIAAILFISYFVIPTLGLQIPQTISSYGMISYSFTPMVRPIHTDGQLIKDDLGNEVMFRGGHLCDSSGIWATEPLVQRIKDYGLNALKVHVWMKDMMPTEGIINESYFASILDARIQWAKNLGLYFVIQLNMNPTQSYLIPSWLQYGVSADQWRTDFWRKSSPQQNSQNYVIQVFRYMASRYADEPHVVFSWFNDNYGGYQTPSEFGQNYKEFSEKCIDAIRLVENVNHLIIVDAGLIKGYGYIIENQPKVNRVNVAWAIRGYIWGSSDTSEWTQYDSNKKYYWEQLMQRAETYFKDTLNIPLIITEFGVPYPSDSSISPPSGWQQHFDDVFAWFATHKYHWFIWQMQNEPTHPSEFYWCLFYKDGSEKPTMTYTKQYLLQPTS